MLVSLAIKNLAIIESVVLEPGRGFTALTGETGAGKSILIDALGLVTGSRADPQLVRAGADKAEISAEFVLARHSPAWAWLDDQGLLDAEEPERLLLRRQIAAEGRTRAFINGQSVNTTSLRELGELLLSVFGQSESLTLLRADTQRATLDAHAADPAPLARVAEAAADLRRIEAAMARLREASARDPAQLDWLRHQLAELEALRLTPESLVELEDQHRRLAHASQLLEEGAELLACLLEGEDSAAAQLGRAERLLGSLSRFDPRLGELAPLLEGAQAQVQEATDRLRQALADLDLDPAALAELEARLAAVQDLARKHRLPAAELPDLAQRMAAELAEAEQGAEALARLEAEKAQALARYREAATALSAQRRATAERLSREATDAVRPLGLPHAQLVFQVEPLGQDVIAATGWDEVRIDFCANPGQALRPLAKVASGGELSRVCLALQLVALQSGGVATMVFDEVDTGISGAVADAVGRCLRRLGATRQVLCVTHLAQVAARAHAQLAIRKRVVDGRTFTEVLPLNEQDRVEELARLQGGAEIGAKAREHAAELLRLGAGG